MIVRAVIYHPSEFSDKLYHDSLSCLDLETQTRIKKFYHRDDACRSLIGHLLVRKMLKDRGIHPSQVDFAKTPEGKPYLATQSTTPPIAYNISHDNSVIALVSGPGLTNPPAFSLGIDVMKVQIPGRRRNAVSIDSFIEVFQDQLTPTERTLLNAPESTATERLERFFRIWTIKEAYTKALGLGLGFDFRRIQIVFSPFTTVANTPNDNSKEQVPIQHVLIDGSSPQEWNFHTFTIPDGEDRYLGVTAELVQPTPSDGIGNSSTQAQVVSMLPPERLTIQDAVSFAQGAISALRGSES